MADPPGPDKGHDTDGSGNVALAYVVRHICLPPELPSSSDDTALFGQKALIGEFQEALDKYTEFDHEDHAELWTACAKMVESLEGCRDKESFQMSSDKVSVALHRMDIGGDYYP